MDMDADPRDPSENAIGNTVGNGNGARQQPPGREQSRGGSNPNPNTLPPYQPLTRRLTTTRRWQHKRRRRRRRRRST